MGRKIIEVIGPPGIGKSSIYKSLCQQWNTNSNWIHQDALLAPKKPTISEFTKWVEYKAQIFLGKKLMKTIPVDYGFRFINKNKELANFCWDHLSNPCFFNDQEIGLRFRSAYFLFLDFCRYQAIIESTGTKPCIIEEGLFQKSFLIHDNAQLMLEALEQYLLLLPLPYAIIYLDTPDRKTITERLRTRKKSLLPYLGKDEEALLVETEKWQQLLAMIFTRIEKEQVLVYKIDATRPIQENAKLIDGILTRIR